MGNIRFYDNKILFVDNKIAMHDDCCCPVYPTVETTCCGDDCDEAYQYYLITFADIDNCGANTLYLNTCECTDYNTTFVVEWQSSCYWLYAGSEDCGGEWASLEVRLVAHKDYSGATPGEQGYWSLKALGWYGPNNPVCFSHDETEIVEAECGVCDDMENGGVNEQDCDGGTKTTKQAGENGTATIEPYEV